MSEEKRVAAVVLAAGMSTRMGANKLLAEIDGEPLVRNVVRAAEGSRARPIVVVSGHDHELVGEVLSGTETMIVFNAQFRAGMSASLRTGIAVVKDSDGAVILLGDMPGVSAALIDNLIAAFDPPNGRAICVATCNGRRGHPVLFARRFFPELQEISGDIGARDIVAKHTDTLWEVEAGDDAPLMDIDTPEDLAQFVRRP